MLNLKSTLEFIWCKRVKLNWKNVTFDNSFVTKNVISNHIIEYFSRSKNNKTNEKIVYFNILGYGLI